MRKIFPPFLLSLGSILSISNTLGSGKEGEERLWPEKFSSVVMAPFVPLSPAVIDLKLHLPEAFFDALEKYPRTPYPKPFSDIPVPVLPKELSVKVDSITLKQLNDVHTFWEQYRDISAKHLHLAHELKEKQEACPVTGFEDELRGFQVIEVAQENKEQPHESEKEEHHEELKGSEKEGDQLGKAGEETKKEGEEIAEKMDMDTESSVPARSLSSGLWGVADTLWRAGDYVVSGTSTVISERFKKREMEKAQREREQAQKALHEAKEDLRKIDEEYVTIQKEAQRRYPDLSLDEIEAMAYQSVTVKKPEEYYPLYTSGKLPSFYPSKPVVAFQLDRQDFEIALRRLPVAIEWLEQENEALRFLVATYKKYIGEHWVNLDGDFLKSQVKAKLYCKFPLISPSSLDGERKNALRKTIQGRIGKLSENVLSGGEEEPLDGKYEALPKYSDESEGKQEEKSGEVPFEKIYAQPENKESYECLKPHRRFWFHVLEELHKKRRKRSRIF